MIDKAQKNIEFAKEYPYDANSNGDWTYLAARAVLDNLLNRKGVGNELEEIDFSIRGEIVESLARIIDTASSEVFANLNEYISSIQMERRKARIEELNPYKQQMLDAGVPEGSFGVMLNTLIKNSTFGQKQGGNE